MRISDWSSDVCSSDLRLRLLRQGVREWRCHRIRQPIGSIGKMHRAAAIDGEFAGNALIRPDDKTIEDIAGHVGRPAITIPSGRRICNSQPSADRTVMTERKRVVEGKRVSGWIDLGGRRLIKKKTKK